jgi:hypothetical protein
LSEEKKAKIRLAADLYLWYSAFLVLIISACHEGSTPQDDYEYSLPQKCLRSCSNPERDLSFRLVP